MDHGWIQTLGSDSHMAMQLSFATEGGSGAALPLRSVEVDDLDEALRRAQALGAPIVYGLRPSCGTLEYAAVLRAQPAGANGSISCSILRY